MWSSPIPEKRWFGFRRKFRGTSAFESLGNFEEAALNELGSSLEEHEAATLGRLLARGKKVEIEMFIRTHGANPLFEPQGDLDVPVGIAKADVVDLHNLPSASANRAILDGEILHVLFQAGEATRFAAGPLYRVNVLQIAQSLTADPEIAFYLKSIQQARSEISKSVGDLLADGFLGPKQPLLLRAALRRVVQDEIDAGRLSPSEACERYRHALSKQKILFFVSRRGNVNQTHNEMLRGTFSFYGFEPANIVTIEQELLRGITADENGSLSLLNGEENMDAGGHLAALVQAVRPGDFTTYTESGRPIKPMEVDALSYFVNRGAKVMNVIRINDMDRHSTEIINGKALTVAQRFFENGYVNVIETVANPKGQKGGTGTTFGNPDVHVLTETHENSFPALSRAFEASMQTYLKESKGVHPAYNAMRQLADLQATRHVLKEFGGRIVFVPRQRGGPEGEPEGSPYVGVDMPMGDLSLLYGNYKSYMFQFAGPEGSELLIHDMKQKENLGIGLRTLLHQLEDSFVLAAAEELSEKKIMPFTQPPKPRSLYGAPCPEFDI